MNARVINSELEAKSLLLSPFFFPEPISTGKYNTFVAQGLSSAGLKTEALCSYPLYPTWKPSWTNEQLQGITAYRGGARMLYPKSSYGRRGVLELWYLIFVACFLVRRRNFAKIVAVFPPSLFMIAVPLLSRSSTPIVGIVHDLQGVYAEKSSGIVGRLVKKVISLVERRAFSTCDHLIFLSEAMRTRANNEYGLDPRQSSVHYPFINIKPYNPAYPKLDYMFKGTGPTLVYSGALGEKQAPDKLMELFVAVLDDDPAWTAIVVSEGPVFERLKATLRHPRIKFFSLVHEDSLAELLERSTIQVIPQDVGTSGGSLPSKLPNIIATNTKLFCITDEGSEVESIVRKYPNGAVSTSWELDGCLRCLRDLMARERIPKGTADGFDEQFSLEGLVARIISVEKRKSHG